MILSINIKSSTIAINDPTGPTLEKAVAEIFHNSFKGSLDYKENDVLVNFEAAEGDNPASATVFIDLDQCKERDHVLIQFQKALIEYMNKTMVGIEHHPLVVNIPPVHPSDGSVG